MKILKNTIWTAVGLFGLAALVAMPAAADQVILDDLIVDGSACVGQDCVNGESFGFDTIRIKENNLRIKAQDTSSTASFPTQDWQLTFNDSTNGGANKFSVDCIAPGSSTPLTVEGCAPSHSLYVDDGGRIGFGTNAPVADLHVVSGNTPTLRLQQDGSSGFTPQTWDLAGNEANFFIRDATSGSTLPFRLFPGAPSNALTIENTGDIGLGTTSPDAELEIFGSGNPGIRITADESSDIEFEIGKIGSNVQARLAFDIITYNTGAIAGSNGDMEFFRFTPDNGDNDLVIYEPNTTTVDFEFDTGSNQGFINGALITTSSRESKQDIVPMDGRDVLARLAGLEIATWRYKASPTAKHVGPMAEDFYSAFGFGPNDKSLSYGDTAGVALAAIQGLLTRVEELQSQNQELAERLAAIEEASK